MSSTIYDWHRAVLLSQDLRASERLVLMALESFVDRKTGCCRPSYGCLAGLAQVSRRTAIRAINTAVNTGLLLKKVRPTHNKTRHRSNLYKIAMPHQHSASPTTPCSAVKNSAPTPRPSPYSFPTSRKPSLERPSLQTFQTQTLPHLLEKELPRENTAPLPLRDTTPALSDHEKADTSWVGSSSPSGDRSVTYLDDRQITQNYPVEQSKEQRKKPTEVIHPQRKDFSLFVPDPDTHREDSPKPSPSSSRQNLGAKQGLALMRTVFETPRSALQTQKTIESKISSVDYTPQKRKQLYDIWRHLSILGLQISRTPEFRPSVNNPFFAHLQNLFGILGFPELTEEERTRLGPQKLRAIEHAWRKHTKNKNLQSTYVCETSHGGTLQ